MLTFSLAFVCGFSDTVPDQLTYRCSCFSKLKLMTLTLCLDNDTYMPALSFPSPPDIPYTIRSVAAICITRLFRTVWFAGPGPEKVQYLLHDDDH